ncbi:hypothetical protein RUND412_001826 [Rhizina undulata]
MAYLSNYGQFTTSGCFGGEEEWAQKLLIAINPYRLPLTLDSRNKLQFQETLMERIKGDPSLQIEYAGADSNSIFRVIERVCECVSSSKNYGDNNLNSSYDAKNRFLREDGPWNSEAINRNNSYRLNLDISADLEFVRDPLDGLSTNIPSTRLFDNMTTITSVDEISSTIYSQVAHQNSMNTCLGIGYTSSTHAGTIHDAKTDIFSIDDACSNSNLADVVLSPDGNPPMHHCPNCNKSFKYLSKLLDHNITHTESKAFECQHCGKSFKREREVKAHSNRCRRQKMKGTKGGSITSPKSTIIDEQEEYSVPQTSPCPQKSGHPSNRKSQNNVPRIPSSAGKSRESQLAHTTTFSDIPLARVSPRSSSMQEGNTLPPTVIGHTPNVNTSFLFDPLSEFYSGDISLPSGVAYYPTPAQQLDGSSGINDLFYFSRGIP